MTNSRLKSAVIGLGRIGWEIESDRLRSKPASHVGVMLMNKNIELVAVCDKNNEKLEKFMKLFPSVNIYNDVFEMLKEELDIITIATPDETHKDLVITCVEFGDPKIILCEKPISNNVHDAKEIVKACNKRGVKLAVNHTRRWVPEYQSVKKVIDSGDYGEPVLFVGYYYAGLRDFCHLADLYNWLTPNTPYAFHRLDYKKTVDYMIFEQDIFLKRGRISIKDNGREMKFFTSEKSQFYEGISELRQDDELFSKQNPSPLTFVYEDLVECALTEKQPKCTGEDGLNALKLSLKVLRGDI